LWQQLLLWAWLLRLLRLLWMLPSWLLQLR
jgi:hypothetical protein